MPELLYNRSLMVKCVEGFLREAGGKDPETLLEEWSALPSGGDDEKLEATCKIVRELEAIAKARREEADRLRDSAKGAEFQANKLRAVLKSYLERTRHKQAKGGLFVVEIRGNGGFPVEWHPEWQHPTRTQLEQLLETNPRFVTLALDKAAVTEAVKDGAYTGICFKGEQGTHVWIR